MLIMSTSRQALSMFRVPLRGVWLCYSARTRDMDHLQLTKTHRTREAQADLKVGEKCRLLFCPVPANPASPLLEDWA